MANNSIDFEISIRDAGSGALRTVSVDVAGCGSNSKTFTMPQYSSTNLDFTWDELRMGPPAPAAGSTYNIRMQIHSMSGTSATTLWWEGQKTITIQ